MAKTYTILKQAVVDNKVIVGGQVQLVGLPNKEAALRSFGARDPRRVDRVSGFDIYTDRDGWTYLIAVSKEA